MKKLPDGTHIGVDFGSKESWCAIYVVKDGVIKSVEQVRPQSSAQAAPGRAQRQKE